MIKIFFAATMILFCWFAAAAQRTGFFVQPQITDSSIDRNLQNHYLSINRTVAQKNQLFLFFPGTGAVPFNYLEVTNTAADLGFHAVALSYPNEEAVNDLCGAPNSNLDCYGNVRLEIKDGIDRTASVAVSRPNSIENRLLKLLIYLRRERPAENWQQFLIDDSTVNWTRVVVAGHSQGGGHAGIIARFHPVLRSIQFAAMDYNFLAGAPANWIARAETTPNASMPDKFWAFSHARDEQVNFTTLSTRVWTAYQMPQFGAIVNVDNAAPPFSDSHSLTSNRECEVFHGCIAADARLVRDQNGVPVYKPIWQYLMSNTAPPFGLVSLRFERGGQIVNRPFVGRTTKNHKIILRGGNFSANAKVLLNGVEASTEIINETEIRATLPAGVFGRVGGTTVQVLAQNGRLSNFLNY